jgi:protein tyrosine kinase modulator
MTLEVVWNIWRRRKWLAIAVALLVLAAVVGMVMSLPNLYRSTATVLVERHQVSETFVRSSVTGELETRLQTMSQEILSRARLEDLINRFGLYQDLRARVPQELIVDKMRRDIRFDLRAVDQTSGRGQTVAFELRYQGRDPQIVAAVTNMLASFYVAANVKLREEQSSGTAEFLRLQLAEMSKRLADQDQRLRDFRTRYVGELPEQMATNVATIERLHAQVHLNNAEQLRAADRRSALARQVAEMRTAIEARTAAEARMAAALRPLADGKPGEAAVAPDLALAEIAKLKQQLRALQQRYTDKYPEVIRLKAEIAALESTVAPATSEAPAAAQVDTAAAKPDPVPPKPPVETRAAATAPVDPAIARLLDALADADREVQSFRVEDQRLRRDIAVYQQRLDNAPKRDQEFRSLSRDYETTKDLHASLLKRYEDARLAETMEQRQRGEQFRILDPALPARQPSAPNRLMLLLAGIAISVGCAVGAVILAERLDTSFHAVDDLRQLITFPILVTIPLVVTRRDRRRRKLRFALATVAVTLALALAINGARYVATGNEALVALLARGGA